MIKVIKVIREKYFDNTVDLSKLSKTFLLWGTGLILVYLSNVILIRWIGLREYGEYAVFMNWVALGSTLITFGWDGFLVQQIPLLPFNAQGKRTAGNLIRKALFTFFFLYMALISILITVKYVFRLHLLFDNKGLLIIFPLLVFLFTGISFMKSLLKIFHTVTPVQWMEDLGKPLLMLLVLGYFYYFKTIPDLKRVYEVNLFLYLGLLSGLIYLVVKKVRRFISWNDKTVSPENWIRKCFYFMCIMVGYSFFSRMELLFLGYYGKNEDAGRYQLLLRIADLVILPDFLYNYYLPQKFSYLFAERDQAGAAILFRNAARTVFYLQVICLAGVSAVGYFYLKSFNISGTEMLLFLLVLSSAQLFYSFFGSTNLVLMTSGNEKYSFMALGIVIVIESLANLLWIPAYGVKAAVYISWGSVLVYTLILYYFVHKKLHFSSPFLKRTV